MDSFVNARVRDKVRGLRFRVLWDVSAFMIQVRLSDLVAGLWDRYLLSFLGDVSYFYRVGFDASVVDFGLDSWFIGSHRVKILHRPCRLL